MLPSPYHLLYFTLFSSTLLCSALLYTLPPKMFPLLCPTSYVPQLTPSHPTVLYPALPLCNLTLSYSTHPYSVVLLVTYTSTTFMVYICLCLSRYLKSRSESCSKHVICLWSRSLSSDSVQNWWRDAPVFMTSLSLKNTAEWRTINQEPVFQLWSWRGEGTGESWGDNKQNKWITDPSTSRWFLLFYSPKSRQMANCVIRALQYTSFTCLYPKLLRALKLNSCFQVRPQAHLRMLNRIGWENYRTKKQRSFYLEEESCMFRESMQRHLAFVSRPPGLISTSFI